MRSLVFLYIIKLEQKRMGFLRDETPEVEGQQVTLLQLERLLQGEQDRKPGEHPCTKLTL